MSEQDFLEYFLVKERLVELSRDENYQYALKGDKSEQLISDIYLARKLIYQRCKTAKSSTHLGEIIEELQKSIPKISLAFDQDEFSKAWMMTIKDIRSNFNI